MNGSNDRGDEIKDNYAIEVMPTRHEVQSCLKVGLEAYEMLPSVGKGACC